MATFGDISVSAASRRLALRGRPDLVISPQQYGPDRYWLLKDPVAMTYFHLRDEEHAIFRMLDGRTSLAEIKRRFEEAFAPLQVTFEQLHAFLARLHHSGLLLADAPGQGEQLLQRRRARSRQAWLDRLGNLLALRLGGVDPQRLLDWLYPRCRWAFSWWFAAACAALVIAAALLAAVQFDLLRRRLPDFQTFFRAGNLIWFAVALALAKGLHELGHALACKHFGGQCHEIGLILLVFTPCLYCDVSDAWTFPNRWQRIAVSAAGMMVELVLAGLCTLLWWYSQPGLCNTLFLAIVLVCSVNTVLLNGNPLLRYDGYYILADLLAVPNLAEQSRNLLARWLGRLCLGLDLSGGRVLPTRRPGLLVGYAVASIAYRWLVVIGILWFGYLVLKPYGMEVVAVSLTGLVVVGLLLAPVLAVARLLGDPGNRKAVRRGRAGLTFLLLAAAAAAVFAVPLPMSVGAPAVLQPRDAAYVHVLVPGKLVRSVAPGQTVEQGQELARLVDLRLDQQIAELTGRQDRCRLQLENLRVRLDAQPSLSAEIPAAEEMLADVNERLRQRRAEREQLVLRAPVAGGVIPPPRRKTPPYTPGTLHGPQGTPLDERNLGSTLETGVLFCIVGDPKRLEAHLVINQSDMPLVRKGQQVRLRLDEAPGEVFRGTIEELSQADLKLAPRELSRQAALAVRTDAQGLPQPAETSYQARVRLDHHDRRLLVGTCGLAKIAVDPLPLGIRWYRALARLFRFMPRTSGTR